VFNEGPHVVLLIVKKELGREVEVILIDELLVFERVKS
jgi:hypothetical protein